MTDRSCVEGAISRTTSLSCVLVVSAIFAIGTSKNSQTLSVAVDEFLSPSDNVDSQAYVTLYFC